MTFGIRLSVLVPLLTVCLLLAPTAVTAEPETLRFGIDAADLGTGDPHRAASRNDRAVVDMIFNGLLRYKPGEAPSLEPDLAVEFPFPELVGGKQVWVFRLREDVMCHPGPETESYQLTADDVVYSLLRAADPSRSAYAGDYVGMTAEKIDDFTVSITLEQPLSSILFFPKVADYAGGLIVCRKAVEAMSEEGYAAHPVGTGPFRFDGYTAGEEVRLKRNESYFRAQPKLAGVVVKYLPRFSDRNQGLQDGELDVIFGSEESEWFEEISDKNAIVVDVFGVGQVITIHLNTSRAPFDDARVRKAVLHGLDRDVFRSIFAEGVAENVFSPVPVDFLPGGLEQKEVEQLKLDYSYDPAEASKLLAEAGYQEGFSLKLVTSERHHYLANYESLRDQLSKLGIDIELEIVDHRTMHHRIRQDENQLVIYVAWRPNADVFLTRFFHSDSIVVSGKSPDTNFSHYQQIDALIEAARQAKEPAKQVRIWKQAQVRLLADAVAYPLHYVNLVYARHTGVDYGHLLKASMALYPQFTEMTQLSRQQ